MRLRTAITLVATLSAFSAASSPGSQDAVWPKLTWTNLATKGEIPRADVLHARVIGIPADVGLAKRAAAGLPTFSRYLTVDGVRYPFTLVGRDVFAARAKNVTIPVNIIPVRFIFPDGTSLDPTAPTPQCDGGGVPLDLTLQSPVFSNYDYGDGPRQFYEFVRRIEFWPYTGGGRVNPNYSVRIAPLVLPVLSINLPEGYTTSNSPCGRRGTIDLVSLEGFLHSQIFPLFSRLGITPASFPIFFFHNIVVVGSSSYLGYHSAFSTPKGIQTYGVAEYDSTHESSTARDVSVLSHEIAEWYEDPFVNNRTPSWGHIGQVSDCDSSLEVGDPLTGSPLFQITMPNGFAYHPQETAYLSWFFRQSVGYGSGGYFSSGRTFTSAAEPCQ